MMEGTTVCSGFYSYLSHLVATGTRVVTRRLPCARKETHGEVPNLPFRRRVSADNLVCNDADFFIKT
jgi:hypothetical protein